MQFLVVLNFLALFVFLTLIRPLSMMSQAIKNFASQFVYEPTIENARSLKKYDHYFLIGMGGSHLAADLAMLADPNLPLTVHSDYGLPSTILQAKKPLVIASSYSGNTEEVIDGMKTALKKKIPVAVIAVGGTLIAYAKKQNLPYIQLPDTKIQPRCALGFSLRALLKLMKDERGLKETKKLAHTLHPDDLGKHGQTLAKTLRDAIPVIYASRQNQAIAYNWKIKLNETGKIPAFYNILPELNHNEMNGFDRQPTTKALSEKFHFIFLTDPKDHPRIQKRFAILEQLYTQRGLPVSVVSLQGKTIFEKIFSSLLLADWTALYTAEHDNLEAEQVPMVEEFKELMH